ncbi:hypothetical protein [Endozoicomonas sp. SCSIO W0465]|uniref:hypothetical protein n=1 Tax=Endozoicomonas sp. SCSIO W0465 TaxID=2918516 RepID=UPI002076406F|nr:hypothetical protein [Endozoicomonas sp. SCSIO W0465]USE35259.1 hypothetical protein MJO57_24640 [Endozoicomonas sp. SCSIO W0465]
MLSIVQSLHFFALYGVSLTGLFLLSAIPSEIVGLYLHQSFAGSSEMSGGFADLFISVLIEPLAMGAAIFFIASRDQGGNLSLYGSLIKSMGIYFQLAISYLIVLVIVMLGFSLYLIPGFYLLYKLMFVEFRVVLKGEPPMEAIKASFNQTRGQWSLLFLPFTLLLLALTSSQYLIRYLLIDQESVLLLQIMGGILQAPFMAFAVVVGFRLFSLTSQPLS